MRQLPVESMKSTSSSAPVSGHAPTPEEFEWNDAFLLGFGPMDDTHREFVGCVRALLDAAEGDVGAALDAFIDHAQRHFEEEAQWMTSTDFPAADCHIDEHEAVLKSAREVRQVLAAGGSTELARSLARELVRWFPGHADYLDSALSQWMVKRRHGGAPVVLRRGLATGSTFRD